MQPSHIHGKMTSMSLLVRLPIFLRGLGLLPILAVTLAAAQLIPVPLSNIRWHGIQALAVEVGGTVLLATLLCRPWPKSFPLPVLRQASLACLHVILVWTAVSCLRDPNPFAVQSLLTLGFGVLTADVTAAQITDQRRLLFVICAVLLAAVLVCISGLIALGSSILSNMTGSLHDHQLFGAFLTIPLLLSLALSFGAGIQWQRVAGEAVLLVCLAGLWESQNRSAWLGLVVSLVVFAVLAAVVARSRVQAPRVRAGAFIPAILLLVAVLGVVGLSPDRDTVFARIQSAGSAGGNAHDSLHWRKGVWAGTRQMIAEKPLLGWGTGSFPAVHQPFTHTGHRADEVYTKGPSIEDEAHNSYLQLWAELGVVGLALWLAALVSFLIAGIRALKRYPARSLPQWALIGCLSALTGQMVDALANPAWQFANVALPLWIILGLIAALTCPVEAAEKRRHGPKTVPVQIGQAVLAAGVGGGLLWVIYQTAFALPAPHL